MSASSTNMTYNNSSVRAATSTTGGNENIILPDKMQTPTSSQCDQNQTNTSIASKVTETRPMYNAGFDYVSLTLGGYPGSSSGGEVGKNAFNNEEHNILHKELALGLEFRANTNYSELKSNLNSRKRKEQGEDTEKEEDNRSLKSPRREEDNFSQNPPTKAKVVTVRMPCNTPVTGDGCQWKKYGQKAAKGSPFPRSYYRCCVTSTCEAKKQVQICPNDLSTLITTYEGVHNHPLPAISTNVASGPTAAVPMSRCASTGSLTSRSIPRGSQTTPSIPSTSQIPLSTQDTRFLISQPSGFPASSITHPKIQFPLVQLGRLSPNFPGSPIFPPTNMTGTYFPAPPLVSPTSPATVCSQMNPATMCSPSSPHNFPVGSSSAQTNISQGSLLCRSNTNKSSLSNKSDARISHLGGLPSPIYQHQLNIYNNNQSQMKTSVSMKQPMQRPTNKPPINNSLISAQQTMNDKIAAATTMITSHPSFQSHVAAVVSSLISNNSSVGLPPAQSQGLNNSHRPLPLMYMPSSLGPLNISLSRLNSQLGNSLSTTFPYHVAEAPLFPTSQNGDHNK